VKYLNTKIETKALLESSLMAVLGVVLAFLTAMPFLSLLIIIYPIPFIVLGVRRGLKYSVLSILVSSILISVSLDPGLGLGLLIMFALMTLIISYFLKKGQQPLNGLIFGAVAWILSTIAMISLLDAITGVNFVDYIREIINTTIEQNANMLPLSEMKEENLKDIYNASVMTIPAFTLMFGIFISFINISLASLVLSRTGNRVKKLPPFQNWKLPDNVNIGIIVLMILTYLLKLSNAPYYETIMSNLVVVFAIGFVIQGFAILTFLLKKRRLPNLVIGLLLGAVFLFIGPLFLPLLILSSLDIILDYRKIRSSRRRFK